MTYRIAQSADYVGRDYWRWSTWVEAEPSEMDAVNEVVWILHPTFSPSRVRSKDRARNFRLDSAGWGTFLLKAQLLLNSGEKKTLKRTLQLEYPTVTSVATGTEQPPNDQAAREDTDATREAQRQAGASRKPAVFLSYSTQDSRSAAKVREGLKSAGVDVLDQTRIAPGELWDDALQRMIREADAVVGIVSDDQVSPWVVAELGTAARTEKPAFVMLGEESPDSGIPSSVERLRVNSFDPEQIAELLRSKV